MVAIRRGRNEGGRQEPIDATLFGCGSEDMGRRYLSWKEI